MAAELLIEAGQVLTGVDGQRFEDGAVLVRGQVIAAVGARADVAPLAGGDSVRVRRSGGTLLPGLIDGHVHLVFDAGPDPQAALEAVDDTELLLAMAGRARQLLDSGVTTVRDLGDRHGLAARLGRAVAAGVVAGPRIISAGAPLTSPGGHCWFLGGEAEATDADRLIRENVGRGAELVKVMATGGGLTRGGPAIWQSQFDEAQVRSIVATARKLGLPVAAHAHGTQGIAAVVAAGVDTIEHCTWMAEGGFEVREDLVRQMAAQGIRVCPAASPNWRAFGERFGWDRAKAMFDRYRWMDELGVDLLCGTDAGVPSAGFDGITGSLQFFEYLGFARERVIRIATSSTAAALGLGSVTGRLVAGYRADLLLVDGDPLADLEALRRPELVVAGGHVHAPAAGRPTRAECRARDRG